VTWPESKISEVRGLAERGFNQCEIARSANVPRSTVRNWLDGQTPGRKRSSPRCFRCEPRSALSTPLLAPAYAYLLGIYLGDGSLSRHARDVYRLRIVLDQAYPIIIEECATAMSLVMPENRVLVFQCHKGRADEVGCYSKHWPCLLPQHGPGRKHERVIELDTWQRQILERWPWRFIRGLIHSDGCRFQNPAVHPRKTYWYSRYLFSNRSDDIRALFVEYCAKVGVECRASNYWEISVAKRESVALMDQHIGPKR
jgi:hypothetical protein